VSTIIDYFLSTTNFDFIVDKIKIDYSHRELFMRSLQNKRKLQFEYFCTFQQSNKAATYDSRVASSRQNSNAMIETYCEGKTPRSILCGLVYAHECALLVFIHINDAKKILVDALGTLRTTGLHSL
jgi:hypothetical protein